MAAIKQLFLPQASYMCEWSTDAVYMQNVIVRGPQGKELK